MSHPLTEQLAAMRMQRYRRDALLFVLAVSAGLTLLVTAALQAPSRVVPIMSDDRKVIAMLVLTLSAIAWGVVCMGVWAIACLWRWAEPLLSVLAIGLALGVIVVGLGLPG